LKLIFNFKLNHIFYSKSKRQKKKKVLTTGNYLDCFYFKMKTPLERPTLVQTARRSSKRFEGETSSCMGTRLSRYVCGEFALMADR
jgi:hypothetical protein